MRLQMAHRMYTLQNQVGAYIKPTIHKFHSKKKPLPKFVINSQDARSSSRKENKESDVEEDGNDSTR